jgi:hypothetical protein
MSTPKTENLTSKKEEKTPWEEAKTETPSLCAIKPSILSKELISIDESTRTSCTDGSCPLSLIWTVVSNNNCKYTVVDNWFSCLDEIEARKTTCMFQSSLQQSGPKKQDHDKNMTELKKHASIYAKISGKPGCPTLLCIAQPRKNFAEERYSLVFEYAGVSLKEWVADQKDKDIDEKEKNKIIEIIIQAIATAQATGHTFAGLSPGYSILIHPKTHQPSLFFNWTRNPDHISIYGLSNSEFIAEVTKTLCFSNQKD